MTVSLAYLDGVNAVVAVDNRDIAAFFADEPSGAEGVSERALVDIDEMVRTPRAQFLKSELASVSDEAWTRFALAMKSAALDSVSGSCALGAWEMRPKRLADLGLMDNLRYTRTPLGRMACDGEFRPPLTKKKFLENAGVQYRVFVASMLRYIDRLTDGSLPGGSDPDMTLSGALAIMHRAGPLGLAKWSDEAARFSDTVDLYQRVNGIF